MSSFARMTAAMFELPFRMFELPFRALGLFIDAILSAEDKKGSPRKGGGSAHRTRKPAQGVARRASKATAVQHERNAA